MATVVWSFMFATSSDGRTSVKIGASSLKALINVVLPAPTGPVKMILCSNMLSPPLLREISSMTWTTVLAL